MGYELSVAKDYEHTTVTATSMTLLIVNLPGFPNLPLLR